MKLTINPLAMLFCDEVDRLNDYETIVQNVETEEIFKIDKVGYEFLKKIEDGGIYVVDDVEYKENREFIDLMLREKVLVEQKYDD